MSDSSRPYGLLTTRLLCPLNSPGKNSTVGCHALLQGIFPIHGSKPHLLPWQTGSLPLTPPEKPDIKFHEKQFPPSLVDHLGFLIDLVEFA